MIENKPIDEFQGRFEIQDKKIHIISLASARLTAEGQVDLGPSSKTQMSFHIDNMPMDDFLSFWIKNKTFQSEGSVSGDIKISGPVNRLWMRGQLLSSAGFIKKLKFDRINLNIEGIYPRLEIANTTIAQTDGLIYNVDGPVVLNDGENFKKQLQALNLSALVSDSKSSTVLTLRQKQEDDTATELKYWLKKDSDKIGSKADESSNMIGLERTMKF